MMAGLLWIVLGLAGLTSADRCPSLTCTVLPDGVCAIAPTSHSVNVSMYACPMNSYCSVSLLLRWANNTLPGGVYNCTAKEEFLSATFLPGFQPNSVCGIQENGKDLKNGYHPKVCQTERDCELEDGTLTPCLCGSNGFSYCLPHMSSRVYERYWDDCVRQGGNLDDSYFTVWMFKYSFYPLLQSPIECAKRIFYEFGYLDSVVQGMSSSAWTLASLGVASVLFY